MRKTPAEFYEFLKDRFEQIESLRGAYEILGKDAETAMAKGSEDDHAKRQMGIAAAKNLMITDPKVEEALERAKEAELGPVDKRNLELMHRYWVHEAGLPSKLAKEVARIEAEGEALHTKLYGTSDWKAMESWYKQSFDVAREVGQIKMEKLGLSTAYEALVDFYSPGLSIETIDTEFNQLDQALRPMIQEALEMQAGRGAPLPLEGPFKLSQQKKINRQIARGIGFDFKRGVHYAIKGHPSMGGSRNDTRITTRLDKNDLIPGIYATIHEAGHAIYQQNLPQDLVYQPVGWYCGISVHESQSMIMEYQATMTPEYLEYLSGLLQSGFNQAGNRAYSADNIKALQTRVTPSFIRTKADEMTYPMHVTLRYGIERKIISGELSVADMPDAWNEGMKDRLGIVPSNHADGCMQDVHWPAGLIGYFPAYAFGAMGAAQFFQAAVQQHPEIRSELSKGRATSLLKWLDENVHGKGSLLPVRDLFTQATGGPLNSKYYLSHLSQRYLGRSYAPA